MHHVSSTSGKLLWQLDSMGCKWKPTPPFRRAVIENRVQAGESCCLSPPPAPFSFESINFCQAGTAFVFDRSVVGKRIEESFFTFLRERSLPSASLPPSSAAFTPESCNTSRLMEITKVCFLFLRRFYIHKSSSCGELKKMSDK